MVSLIEEEYEVFTRERRWKQVFDRIQNEATTLHNSTAKHARLPENRDRNRYRDVSPYDDFRVLLKDSENNYINASYVEVPHAGRKYILTQGPLANTSGHFWLMVWQQNSKGVLMLNKVIEDGRLKCHPYFPMGAELGGEDTLTFDDVNLKVEHKKLEDRGFFVIRTLNLVHLQTGEEKEVLQFHYVDWPDFGIPKNSESFLSYLYAVRQSGVIPSTSQSESTENQMGPPVIHCSAGIGRSGTFCLVDSALVLVERTRSLQTLDPRSMLIDMRQYRCGLIQRPEQLQFSYMAIIDGARTLLSAISNSTENGTENGTDFDFRDSNLKEADLQDSEEETESSEEISDDEPNDAYPNGAENSDTGTDALDDFINKNTNASDDRPAPPVPGRSSSLASDEQNQSNSPDDEPPEKMYRETPEPPRRTSSLHKSASLDEHPPPVPPRPPSTMNRQVSAPPIPEAKATAPYDSDDDEECSYENTSSRPIGMYNNAMKRKRDEMRDEKKKRTKELVEAMRSKQIAAEAAKEWPSYLPSRGMLIGAGLVVAFAAGAMYVRSAFL